MVIIALLIIWAVCDHCGISFWAVLVGLLLCSAFFGKSGEVSHSTIVSNHSPEVFSRPQSTIERYIAAYDAHSENELANIVEELIGDHYCSYSSKDWDTAIRFESAVKTRPYVYHGPRSSCQGLTLTEIFHRDNAYINSKRNP